MKMDELSPDQLRAIVFGGGEAGDLVDTRRQEVRFWSDSVVKFTIKNGSQKDDVEHEASVMDSSVHGLRFKTGLPLEKGTILKVEFTPDESDSPIISEARVVRVKESSSGYEVGVVFGG
jgi:hypothetical protein